MSTVTSEPKCDRCQTPMERYAVPGTGGKEQAWRLACPCQHSATPDVARTSKERPLLDVIRDIRDMLGVIAPADFVDPAGDKMRAAESAWCLADNVLFAATVAPAPETREQRTRQAPIADDKLTLEVALREAERCRRYPDPVLNEQVIVVLADALHAQKANSCVCGEPNSPGTHRTDGPCLASIGDHHP